MVWARAKYFRSWRKQCYTDGCFAAQKHKAPSATASLLASVGLDFYDLTRGNLGESSQLLHFPP